MPAMDWKQAIAHWRKLPQQERRLRHLRAIPRHVANSMAMEEQPISEQSIRIRLQQRIPELANPKPG
jgi:hypothetical protein